MTVIPFNTGACQKVMRYLDSYISGELLVETNHEVLHHLEECERCHAEYEARVRLRGALREAVRSDQAPAELQIRIRRAIRERRSKHLLDSRQWGVIAASLALASAGWIYLRQDATPFHALNRAAQESYISRASTRLAGILRAGFGDHLHCSVGRRYPDQFPQAERAVNRERLGPEFTTLVPVVRELVPDNFTLILAHRCRFNSRPFVHFTFRRRDGRMLSLVIADKGERESFPAASLLPALRQAGIPVYQGSAEQFQVAGFESSRHLAYVVSDMSRRDNLQIAAAIAPAVKDHLDKLKS